MTELSGGKGGMDAERLAFARLVAAERRRRSLSQQELADLVQREARRDGTSCRVERRTIYRYEIGRVIPKPDTVRWIARALNVSTGAAEAAVAQQQSARNGTPRGLGELELQQRPADTGMRVAWSTSSTVALMEDWLRDGLVDRRGFLALSGAALAAAAVKYLSLDEVERLIPGEPSQPDKLLEHVKQNIEFIRQLDDTEGGAAHLDYAGSYLRTLATLLRTSGRTPARLRGLLGALGELGQQAGWMAFDSAQYGLSQRYYLLALRAAHDADDRALAAHVLADLALQSAEESDRANSVAIGEAARAAAQRSTANVRSSVLTRISYSYAVAGDRRNSDRCSWEAHDLIEQRHPGDEDPHWIYYMTPGHVRSQSGYALIHRGRNLIEDGDAGSARKFLADGVGLLDQGAHGLALDHPHQRRALFEGAWLALGLALQGDIERSCDVGRTAVARLSKVSSPRSVRLLNELSSKFKRGPRARHVREFLPELTEGLSGSWSAS